MKILAIIIHNTIDIFEIIIYNGIVEVVADGEILAHLERKRIQAVSP
jgi:hypothetical protein